MGILRHKTFRGRKETGDWNTVYVWGNDLVFILCRATVSISDSDLVYDWINETVSICGSEAAFNYTRDNESIWGIYPVSVQGTILPYGAVT